MITIKEMTAEDLKAMIDYDDADRKRFELTEENIEPLVRYIEHRIEPGSFLMAVLESDLEVACGCADMHNRRKLFEYVEYLSNYAPRICWGTPERVSAWLSNTGVKNGN